MLEFDGEGLTPVEFALASVLVAKCEGFGTQKSLNDLKSWIKELKNATQEINV